MKTLIAKSYLADATVFVTRLTGIGMELSPVIWLHERVYVPHEYRAGQNLARLMLRTEVRKPEEPARYELRLKRHVEDSGVNFVNRTAVGEYTEAMEIIHQMGYRKIAEVSRQRQEVWFDERTVIYLDQIEGIEGYFLKIEVEMDDESVEALWRDLLKILQMLGQKAITVQTYAEILQRGLEEMALPEEIGG